MYTCISGVVQSEVIRLAKLVSKRTGEITFCTQELKEVDDEEVCMMSYLLSGSNYPSPKAEGYTFLHVRPSVSLSVRPESLLSNH